MNNENKKRKIVVYSHDTFGLGNIRRMLAIAKSIVESDPYVSILILSGSPMLHAFRIPSQIDYIANISKFCSCNCPELGVKH